MAGKVIKVIGNKAMASRQRPERLRYAVPTKEIPNTTLAKKIEDVFIPFYDRPGYLTDNCNQAKLNGQAFEIPANRID